MIDDYTAFIEANTRLLAVPLVPRIRLYLAEEAMDLWQRTEDALERGYGPPPFWAFAWAGGQALARYVLDHPSLVAGKRVLDLASGSGLVAIAAALAGARQVEASDLDCFAGAAISLNARENGVSIEIRLGDLVGSDEPWDVILAGDVAYQQAMADPMTAWLEERARSGLLVLIGDPGRAYLPREKLRSLASYDVEVPLFLEDSRVKRTDVWSFIPTS